MTTLETVLLILLIVDAIALVGLVLIQQSKGADVGAAFGSGSAGTVFGASGGASFLVKVTSVLAILFFVITFALAYTAKQRADLVSGFDLDEVVPTSTVDEGIPDIGAETAVDMEGDELPILDAPTADDLAEPMLETVEGTSDSAQ